MHLPVATNIKIFERREPSPKNIFSEVRFGTFHVEKKERKKDFYKNFERHSRKKWVVYISKGNIWTIFLPIYALLSLSLVCHFKILISFIVFLRKNGLLVESFAFIDFIKLHVDYLVLLCPIRFSPKYTRIDDCF